ncbi:MAG: hypothetical protein PHD87_01700 [Candidatus Cloacimonetes bacterium]|nr:hypothetical protein [Candidatus Cloacimonadota bacterium]
MFKHLKTALLPTLLLGTIFLPLAAQTNSKEANMKEIHQTLAVDLFNQSWDLLLKPDRSLDETDTLINQVHASLWHWRQIGQPINILRGEWMVCHVYTLLEHPEAALYHANNVLRLKDEIQPTDWDLAYCYEAMARVMALKQDREGFQHWYALAVAAGKQIAAAGDRGQFEADLNDDFWFGMQYQPQ